jgi:hypothetical protein
VFSPDGQRIIDTTSEGTIEYRALPAGNVTKGIAPMAEGNTGLSRVGRYLLVGEPDNQDTRSYREVEIRSIEGDLLKSFPLKVVEPERAMFIPAYNHATSPRCSLVAENTREYGVTDVVVRSWPEDRPVQTLRPADEGPFWLMAISERGEQVAVSTYPKDDKRGWPIEVFSVATGASLTAFRVADEPCSLAFMRDHDILAIGTRHGKVELRSFVR